MSIYRKILKRAWTNTVQKKYLWFFGLFTVFFTSEGVYLFLINTSSGNMTTGGMDIFYRIVAFLGSLLHGATWKNFFYLMIHDPFNLFLAIFFFVFTISIFVFIVWLSNISQVAIVHNTALSIDNKEDSFHAGIEAGMRKVLPVFSLNLLAKIIFYGIFILINYIILLLARTSFLSLHFNIANLVFTILFVVFISFVIIFSFIVKYAIAYVVIHNKTIKESFISAFKLFIKNWLSSIELAFVLFSIDFFASFALLILIAIFTVPFMFFSTFFLRTGSYFLFWFLLFIAFVLFLLIGGLGRAMISVFSIYSWTDFFLILNREGAISKLLRLSGSFKRTKDKK